MNKKNKSEFTLKFLEDLTSKDLVKKLDFLKKTFFNLRFQKVLGELKNTSKFKIIKKDIARINTQLNKRKTGV